MQICSHHSAESYHVPYSGYAHTSTPVFLGKRPIRMDPFPVIAILVFHTTEDTNRKNAGSFREPRRDRQKTACYTQRRLILLANLPVSLRGLAWRFAN